MPKNELDGLPVIDADETEKITVTVRLNDMLAGDPKNPERHPIAIALRRQQGVDDARVTDADPTRQDVVRFDAPDKGLFKELQKTLTGE